jgi:hypothetical protein
VHPPSRRGTCLPSPSGVDPAAASSPYQHRPTCSHVGVPTPTRASSPKPPCEYSQTSTAVRAQGFSPLHIAVRDNLMAVVEHLADKGADLNSRENVRAMRSAHRRGGEDTHAHGTPRGAEAREGALGAHPLARCIYRFKQNSTGIRAPRRRRKTERKTHGSHAHVHM